MNFILLIIFEFQQYNFYGSFIVFHIILFNELFPNLIHLPCLLISHFHLSLTIIFLISPFLIPNNSLFTNIKFKFFTVIMYFKFD